MSKQEQLIVITDYEELVSKYADPKLRTIQGVVVSPMLISNKYCLPLGWEVKLIQRDIKFTVELVEIEQTDII